MTGSKKILLVFLLCSCLSFFFFSSPHAQTQELRILYVNDFHGFAEPEKLPGKDEPQGGIAYLASLTDKLGKEKPALLLAAGDMIQGNTWANLFQGKPVIEVMNAMGFDAMVVGNHEFDFGQDVLKERIHEAKFSVLGANVQGLPELKPYVIKDVAGLKIAIIGVVTEDTLVATHPKNVAGLTFLSVSETIEKYVKELRSKVDLIIVLSHIGYSADMMLAHKMKGIDVIVGGHSHTKTDKHMLIGETIIVQAWEHGLVLGVLDLKIKDGKVIEANSELEGIKPASMKKHDGVASIVEKYSTQISALMDKVIGEAETDLDGAGVHVRTQETNLGNLIADITKKESGSDAAIINGGGIRASIGKGDITINDIYSVLPFDNYIISIKLSGKQIMDALEYGVSAVELKEGRFPQVSGISFVYSRVHKNGPRVEAITINRKPLEQNKIYTIATNDFLAAGGDGYQVFREAIRESPDFSTNGGMIKSANVVYNDSGRWLRDVVVQYITTQKKIAPSVEGRIKETVCNEDICQ